MIVPINLLTSTETADVSINCPGELKSRLVVHKFTIYTSHGLHSFEEG